MNKDSLFLSAFLKYARYCLLLTASGCTQVAFGVINLPTHFDDTTVIHNTIYGPEPWQKLDIYIPSMAKEKKLDVVVFFYGGRWTTGSKDDYGFIGSAFANKGFIVVIPDYSKYPKVHFPTFVQDGAKALAWTYDNIAQYGGDSTRIHVSGHSAGAHIGSLLTADPHYLKAEGKDRSLVIHDFAGLAGPYDFTPDEPDLEDMFSPPEKYPEMQATTFIDGQQPPMLLLHGKSDTLVKISNLEKLEQRIKEKGGCEKSILYPGIGHIGIVTALSWINPKSTSVLEDMVSFFQDPKKACKSS